MSQPISIPATMPMTAELAELVAERNRTNAERRAAFGRYKAAERAHVNPANLTTRHRYDAARAEYHVASRVAAQAEQKVIFEVLAFAG